MVKIETAPASCETGGIGSGFVPWWADADRVRRPRPRPSLILVSKGPGRMPISCVSLPPTYLSTINNSSLMGKSKKDAGHTGGRLRGVLLRLKINDMTCECRYHRCDYDVERCRQSCSSRIGRLRGTAEADSDIRLR